MLLIARLISNRPIHYPILFSLLILVLFTPHPVFAATNVVGATPGSFRVSESGAAAYSIPLTLPPGTAGMTPKLALTYNSQGGNGILGMGWSLEGLSGIYRCPASITQDGFKGGINFDGNDRFCLDGQRLVAISGNYGADGTEYRTETESYSRIISYGTAGSGPSWFKVWTKAGQVAEYGNSYDSRIEAQGRADVRQWGVNKVSDTKGNYWTATYNEDQGNGEAYISRVDYTGNAAAGVAPYASVQFGYESRPDVSVGYEAGSILKTGKRIANIKTYHGTTAIKEYRIAYELSLASQNSRMSSFTECTGDGACLPPTVMEWQGNADMTYSSKITSVPSISWDSKPVWGGDYDGDGKGDLLVYQGSGNLVTLFSNGNGNYATKFTTVPSNDWSTNSVWSGDYNGDGRSDILSVGNAGTLVTFFSNGSGGYFTGKIALAPSNDWSTRYAWSGDYNGDGKSDILSINNAGALVTFFSKGDGTYYLGKLTAPSNFSLSHVWGGDYNGDGRSDILSFDSGKLITFLSNGNGDYSQKITSVVSSWDSNAAWIGDYNGDGKSDILSYYKGDLITFFSKGDGTFNEKLTNAQSNNWDSNHVWKGDYNSDGKSDILSYYGGNLVSFLSKGDGTYKEKVVNAQLYNWNSNQVWEDDYNGDGRLDIVSQNSGNLITFFSTEKSATCSPCGTAYDVLSSITNGLGTTTRITYKPLTDTSVYNRKNDASYPYLDFQRPIFVVSNTQATDGVGGNYGTNYSYTGAKLHLTGGGYLGFRTVTTQDPQTGITTITTYRQDYPNQGLPEFVEKTTSSGQRLNKVLNNWQNPSLGANLGAGAYAYHRSDLTETVEESWDLNGAAMPRNKTTTEYDDYGNATKITVATDDGYTTAPVYPYGNIKLTENTYSNDTTNWILGRLTRATVTSTLPTGATATHTSAFDYETPSGLLVKEVVEPDNPTLKVVTEHTPDVFGNRKFSTISGIGIDPRGASSQYDNQGRFPISSSNALGHTENRIFDPGFGNLLSMTGPNGLTTTWVYDGFGRKTQENRPDGTRTSHSYAWCDSGCPANAVYSITTTSSGSPNSTAYFDSLNRQIRAEKVGFDGRIIVQDTHYDALGRIASSTQPYYQGDSVVSTQYQYDILGRVTQTTAPDSGTTSTEYNGLVTTVTNALGFATQQEKNGLGQLVKTTDALSFSMLFAYDPFGNLIETTDPYGNQVVIDYDIKGRKIAMHDPDMGDWSYQYNVLGELIAQKNAKGQTTTLLYDKLGRMTQRKEPGLTSSWTWDSAAMGKGKLAKFKSSSGHSRSYTYDNFGRTTSVKTIIKGELFSISTQYDEFSRILKTIYPTGFAVSNVYNDNGYLSEVRDEANNKPFWQAINVDALGHIVEESLGNGLVTQRTYDFSGRIIGIHTQPFSGDAVQDLSLTWDLVGNLTNRNDEVIHQNDLFSYDELNRLTSATYSDNKLLSLDYDAIGNITYKSDVGSYSYGAKPHAVTKITGTLNSGFVYDADGNQTKGLNNRTIRYTTWDMPAKMTQGSNTLVYDYDANHERFRQTSLNSKTIYINPRIDQGAHFEQTIKTVGTASLKESRHYIYAGAQVIGEYVIFNSGAKETRYFHSDHLGSINAVTNNNGKVLARYGYEPFGKQTTLEGDANTINHGFTGHEQLAEVGLIHMNGRVYDPITARFLSADPTLQFPDNLQNYNRYSYVMNNPLAFTDPSGYGLGGFLKKLWRNDIVRSVASIAAAAVTGQVWAVWGPFGSSAFGLFAQSVAQGFVGSLVQTGSLNGAAHGAFTAGLFYGAGDINESIHTLAGKAATHAVVGCISSEVSGGKCGQGALAAGFAKAAGPYTQGWGEVRDLVAHSVVGGTGSVLGGGKFANGAMTGAYGYLFNDIYHENTDAANNLHRRLVVRDENGNPIYGFSFGLNSEKYPNSNPFTENLFEFGSEPQFGKKGNGIVFADMNAPSTNIVDVFRTSPKEDMMVVSYMMSRYGDTAPYNAITNNCRNFSANEYNKITSSIINYRSQVLFGMSLH